MARVAKKEIVEPTAAELADMLADVMSVVENHSNNSCPDCGCDLNDDVILDVPQKVRNWYEKAKKIIEEKKANLRASVLDRLTEEERNALGF